MNPVAPIDCVELFPPLSRELLAVLRNLDAAEWAASNVCGDWTVKDVAAHLLGGNLGRLWKREETSQPSEKTQLAYAELLALIDRSNAEWVQAARRIGPEILVEFLEVTDQRLYEHFKTLNPDQLAGITVAWASDDLPPNWFDIAREYTEKWLHQQHIREAVGQPVLAGRKFLFPVLDTFLRGLPRAYRGVEAQPGTSLTVQILGEAGGDWSLVREAAQWRLFSGRAPQAACCVRIEQDLAWRLFTKGANLEDAQDQVQIEGEVALGRPVLGMVSIMA